MRLMLTPGNAPNPDGDRETATSASAGAFPRPAAFPAAPPAIPDHELIRRIGGGSYGEVWLARNALGAYRAVKIISRRTFEDSRPFEREFRGIQKFEPISRSHDGLVDILQVGRTEECFYYVMELADDAADGTTLRGAGGPPPRSTVLDPERYEARAAQHRGSPGSGEARESATAGAPLGWAQEEESQESAVLEIGMRVRHEKFGVGQVQRIEGQGDRMKVTVVFGRSDAKKFVARYARLVPVT